MSTLNSWPKSNLHTHTVCCDGKNSAEEMVLSAISHGFESIGFSGHSYTSFDESYCMSKENTIKYAAEIKYLKEKYRDQIKVFYGIEQDFFSGPVPDCYDYSIGSVHAFFKEVKNPEKYDDYPEGVIRNEKGFYIYADFSSEPLKWAIDSLYGGDSLALAEDYYSTVSKVAEVTGCSIVGHLDLLTKLNESHKLFDETSVRYLNAAEKAVKALINSNPIFEINTGAISRGYRSIPYPSDTLLRMIRENGGRITISSDCHQKDNLTVGFDMAVNLAKECGFTTIWIMSEPGVFTETPIP